MSRPRLLALAAVATAVAACASVLGLKSSGPQPFPHRKHVLIGTPCTTCHVGVEKAGEGGVLHLPTDATCTREGCHAKPHDTHPCLSCHSDPNAVAAVGEAKAHLKFSHVNHMPRANGNCMRCHIGVAESDVRLRPQMATCFLCHEHDAMRDGRRCDVCHKDLAEEGTLPQSHLTHDGDWLREHGTRAAAASDLCSTCHRTTFCSECHGVNTPALPSRLHFDDPGRASVHRAGFIARHEIEARAQPGACNACHTPSSCQECHTREHVAPDKGVARSPHPAGWVGLTPATDMHGPAARRDPAECAACHGGAGERLCVRCHQVGGPGGNPHPPGWSSRQPLSALPCRLCHPLGSAP